MNYRSVNDLDSIIVENLHCIPDDIDLIVGIPRSGMLAASLLALHLNLPLTDIDGFIEGRLMGSGLQRKCIKRNITSLHEARRALIVDDSLLTGAEMKRARNLVDLCGLTEKTIFAAVICSPEKKQEVRFGI